MMKPYVLGISILIAVAGCTSFGTYYKPGTTLEKIDRDTLSCRTRAEREVPPRIIIDRNPVYGPPRTPGGPPVILYWETNYIDLNEGLRGRVRAQCMSDAGYERVTIPYCTEEQLAGKTFKPLAKTPQLDDAICAIRRDGKRILIDLDKPL